MLPKEPHFLLLLQVQFVLDFGFGVTLAACRRLVICLSAIVTRPSRSTPMSSSASFGGGANCIIDRHLYTRLMMQPHCGAVFGVQSTLDPPHPSTLLQPLQLVLGFGFGFGVVAAACKRPAIAAFVMRTRPSRSRLRSWTANSAEGPGSTIDDYLSARPSSICVPPQFFTEFVEHPKLCGAHPSTVLQPLQLALSGAVGALGGFGFFTAACRRPAILGFAMLIRPSRSRLMS
jgi:hypothetical protein